MFACGNIAASRWRALGILLHAKCGGGMCMLCMCCKFVKFICSRRILRAPIPTSAASIRQTPRKIITIFDTLGADIAASSAPLPPRRPGHSLSAMLLSWCYWKRELSSVAGRVRVHTCLDQSCRRLPAGVVWHTSLNPSGWAFAEQRTATRTAGRLS